MRKVEMKAQGVTLVSNGRYRMNNLLGIISIIQATNVSAVCKTTHKVIIFEFPIKIDINDFIISLP